VSLFDRHADRTAIAPSRFTECPHFFLQQGFELVGRGRDLEDVRCLTAGPLSAGGFTCPSGQRLVLASVSYSNIVLTDTTNGVSTNLGNTSRTFFQL
jgi:hypothetical protein